MMTQAPPRPLRAGLFGRGAFGDFLAQTLSSSNDVRIVAVASRSAERAREFAAQHGIEHAFGSYDQMLGLGEFDLVMIATPPARHMPDVLAAIDAGKHVLIEKPLATSVADAEQLLAAARKAGKLIGIDYPMPYTAIVRALAEVTRTRAAGKLVRVAVENIASCEQLDDDHWFWNPQISGGIFVEHGVHFFDWCGSLLGAPQTAAGWAAKSGKREDRVFAAIGHDGGALATYYHAFIARAVNERTRAILSFESCDAFIDGWIPIRLRLVGLGAKDAAQIIRNLNVPDLRQMKPNDDAIVFDAGEKAQAYARGVSLVVADLCRAIRDPAHRRLVDEDRALNSLRVAAAARTAAASGNVERLAG